MASEIRMPKFGLTMTEGVILKWNKEVGDQVSKGESIVEVETDKVSIEVESPAEGILLKKVAECTDVVPVGGLIGFIGEIDEVIVMQEEEKLVQSGDDIAAIGMMTNATDELKHFPTRVLATPAAKHLARQNLIDLATIASSENSKIIKRKDVERAIMEKKTKDAEASDLNVATLESTRAQSIMALRMTESFTTTPHFYLTVEVDATEMLALLDRVTPHFQSKSNIKATFTDALVWMLGRALHEHPRVNAFWNGDSVCGYNIVNIGIATAVGDNLIVPVISSVEKMTLHQLAVQRYNLVSKAREGKLVPSDYEGGTFTLSNLGMYGIKNFLGIINPPQAALLSVGTIMERPVVIQKNIEIRPMFEMTLACDHRVLDGAMASRFLVRLKNLIEKPERLLDSFIM